MSENSYQKLLIWQKSMDMVTVVYAATKRFPKDELYSLTNQIRRSAVSIPSNIAEGKSRYSTKEFVRFLLIARGSVAELETQLIISRNLSYISSEELGPIIDSLAEIGRMISGLISKLEDEK